MAHCYYIPADSSDNLINDTGSGLMLHELGQLGEDLRVVGQGYGRPTATTYLLTAPTICSMTRGAGSCSTSWDSSERICG